MKRFCIGSGLLLVCLSAAAQSTDFSGKWLYRDQEIVSGNSIGDGTPTRMTVTQKSNAMDIVKLTEGGNVDVTTTETVGFDGKPFQTKSQSGGRKLIAIKWSGDQKTFTETTMVFSTSDSTKPEYRVTDTWSMENGRLVLHRKDENLMIGDVVESRLFYEKQ
jgi:hypothetical protein